MLVCPRCGAEGTDAERFCARCGMPLTFPDPVVGEVSERQARARKVSPQYGEGELVKVGWARNQAEAELLSGMLLEEGIPSVVRRARGFDVPDFLAGGPRDILVAASGVDAARDVLRVDDTTPTLRTPRERAPWWVQALAWFLVLVTALGSIVFAIERLASGG